LPDARYAVAYDGGSIGGTGLATITQVFVNPGNWAVSGKLGVTNEGSSPAMVLCVLTTGQFVDRTWAYLGPAGSSSEREAESFILAFASPSEQMVSISCDPHGGQVHIYDATILTTQVGALS
jgi:hypothetical protein